MQYAKLKVEHGWWVPLFEILPTLLTATGSRIKQNLNEVENLYFRHSRKSRPESELDESLERGESRPLPSVLRPDNTAPSPSISSPMDDEVALVEGPVRPPSCDGRLNHPTRSLSMPVEEKTSATPDPDDSVPHSQQTTGSAPPPSSSLATHSPTPHSLSRQPTLSSLDGSAGRSPGRSSGSTLTYDSFWSSHSSSSISTSYRSRLSESSFASLKQPFTTSFTHVQKSNPIIPTLSFPSSPPTSNSLHTAMGSFHHADLARQENGSFLPPQP